MTADYDVLEHRKLRVLVVEEHVSISEMLSIVLDRERRFTVIGEAASADEARKLFNKYKPDFIITSLELPDKSGADLITTVRGLRPDIKTLIYSGTRNKDMLLKGLNAQPNGFVHKSEPLAVLVKAFHTVAEGASFFSPFFNRLLADTPTERKSADDLTEKERNVLKLVAEGKSSREAAVALSLSPKTVEHYRMRLMQKLGLRDVASLTRYAVRSGLIDLG